MKKKALVVIALVATIILLLGGIVYSRNIGTLSLKIQGVSISKDEYVRAMNSKRYEVSQYFIKKYGARITEDFWTKDFDGEYPYQMLADKTIKELTNIHAIYEIAKNKEYVDSADYDDFVARLENENKLREENIKSGKPVYGLSKYTEDLFLEYETDQLQKAYCNDINNEGMDIKIEEGKEYYEKNKDVLFIKNDDFELSYVKVYYGYLGLSEEEVRNLKNQMIDISKKIDENNSLQSLVENNELLKEYYTYEKVLSEEVYSKVKNIGDVIEIAMELYTGDITQVIDQNECLYLIQCINRIDYYYIPYEEVQDNVKKALREQHYEDIVARCANELEIVSDTNNIYSFTKNNIK